jgi:protease-4
MIRLPFRLLYNATIYPLALLLWLLRRRAVLRRGHAVKLRLMRMPPIAPRRRLFRRTSLVELARDLDRAAADPLLRGLFVSLDGFSASAVDFYELAVLLERFERSGKLLHIFIERVDSHSLIAGRAARRLTTDPSGPVMVHGVGVEMPFMGELLERYGIEVQGLQRGEYKGLLEPFVRREPSSALLESLRALVDSIFEQLARELAPRLGRTPDAANDRSGIERARTALEEGPYTIGQAVARQLIDAAQSPEQSEHDLAEACGNAAQPARTPAPQRSPQKGARSEGRLRQLPAWPVRASRPAPLRLTTPARLAFVPITGLIVDRPMPISRGGAAVATDLVPRIRALAHARAVDAIVLVIDSRGGSATASDMIWSAARYALAKKPVVAWMRSYAASGGYYVAAAAERIIASPFTITGSIGVVAAKPNVAEAAARLGIRPVSVRRGGGVALFSPFQPLTGSELAWYEAYLDESYERFKSIVAEGRRMSGEAVEEVARGRIWTGPQAHERGLVDTIGAFPDVVAAARELGAIPAAKPHEIVWAAPREGLLEMARSLAGPRATEMMLPELATIVEPLLLSRLGGALYYMPIFWS